FLLSYFAEHVTIPIELQFSGVALVGAAMIGAGAWLRNARRAYALALVGGGLGVLYLTTFAALQLVPLLSPPSAFALLAAIAFLAAFFLAYVAVPIVHALRGAGERRIDAILIFGVPMVGLALQALLVQDTRYALAWTAAIIAAMYALLWRALRRTKNMAMVTLAAAFGALALIFATLTVPLAVDARWTSAVWAVEAAGVYWIGCRDDRVVARGFALALQFATGIVFLVGGFN